MATIEKAKEKSSIQLSKTLIARLSALGRKGDTYEAIIERLLDGKEGDAHGDREDEPTGDSSHKRGKK